MQDSSTTAGMTTATPVVVEQVDREAAAAGVLRRMIFACGYEQPWMDAATASMRMGEQDDHEEVQAFARHRHAERGRLATWIEGQRNHIAATGEEFAAAIREKTDA